MSAPLELVERAIKLQAENARLRAALKVAHDYMELCLGAPSYQGPNPYPIIEAALAAHSTE